MHSIDAASSKGKMVRSGLSRSSALKIAAAITFLNGFLSLILFLPALSRGAASLDQTVDTPPYVIVVTGFAFSILMIIAAYGAWKQQRWGIITILLVASVGAVLAAPGVFVAPNLLFWVAAAAGVLANIASVVLCLWRDPKATGLNKAAGG
jgi:hypothetical protein